LETPELLDQLCISGEVVWGRLSPHPAFEDQDRGKSNNTRRVRPTRSAPVALFLRQDAPWLLDAAAARASAHGQSPDREQGLSGAARQVLESLGRRGASFLADVVADTRQLTSIVEDALWQLAAAGLVTADGFENLRALIDPKRRLATARHSSRRPRFVPGRRALLRSHWGLTPVLYGVRPCSAHQRRSRR
jgi:ATP-dependent Lhr-like helicase